MAWVREGESPENIKVSFVVSVKEHPELANFIWSLPYRATSKALRDILSAAVQQALQQQKDQGQQSARLVPAIESAPLFAPQAVAAIQTAQTAEPVIQTVKPAQANAESVSHAAASIIQNFDKMFPS